MFDLFFRLIRVDLYVRFFVRLHVRFLPDIFVRHVLVWFFPDFLSFCPIFCLIFLSEFYPIFYVRIFLSDFFMSYFLCSILLSYVLSDLFCPSCSCPIFFWFFDPISCPIFARFLSDFLRPIFFVRFFVRIFCPTCSCPIFFVQFFVLFSLSDFLPYFLPDLMSRLFVWFFVLSFWPICCHIFCVISRQKRWNMSCHVLSPLSCTTNVLVFLLLWQYRTVLTSEGVI